MSDFFKLNFKWILLAGVFLLLFFKGCFNGLMPQQPTVKVDTTYIVHVYESAPYTPSIVNVLPSKPTVINQPQYQADTSSIQALRKQFDALVQKHTNRKTYNDTLKVDTLGWVNVKDTVSENEIKSRKYSYNIRERLITKTITQPYKPKNQLYFGGAIQSPLNNPSFNQVEVGVLLKNKRDNIIGLSGTYDLTNPLIDPQSGIGLKLAYYSKISLRLF